ncbi:MAG: phosphoethanolamine transferase [bacterium]
MLRFLTHKSHPEHKILLYSTLFMLLTGNLTFFKQNLAVYPVGVIENLGNTAFLISLTVVLFLLTTFIISLFAFRLTLKPVLIFSFLLFSIVAYFNDNYGVVIGPEMVLNALNTDSHEVFDLLNLRLLGYFVFLGLLPSLIIFKINIEKPTFVKSLKNHLILLASTLSLAIVIILAFSSYYSTYFREYKQLRFYANPAQAIVSILTVAINNLNRPPTGITPIANDAHRAIADQPRLMIFVVGETARADRFSLNGYTRDTNPKLKQQKLFNFQQFNSCGTSTAKSVPCMFSHLGRSQFKHREANYTENVLDVLQRTGVNVIWIDNNSDSKGVADRVTYLSYRTPDTNPICNPECRDAGMLSGLDQLIKNKQDNLIVLHQMGSHGPAYYKRYVASNAHFKPECMSNHLESCTQQQLDNSYDNTIVATDDFLNQVIEFLRPYKSEYKVSLLYVSDHGESLGENGLYLHGLPYFIAPEQQTHVPAIIWTGSNMQQSQMINTPHSHDDIFSSLLGFFAVSSSLYNANQDLFLQIEDLTP